MTHPLADHCFWLDPQSGDCYDATTHAQWLVQNAAIVELEHAVEDLDPACDADELHLIGVRSGLVRVSHNGRNLFVQFHARPAQVQSVLYAVRDFLRNKELPPLHMIRLRNSLNGDERAVPIADFQSIVERGGQVFAKSNPTTRFVQLVVYHIALGWLLILVMDPREPSFTGALWIGLVTGEASLLGFWFAWIERPEWRRPLLSIIGLTYLAVLVMPGIESVLVIFGTAAMTALVIIVFRFARIRLYRLIEDGEVPKTAPLQFSIRQMMMLTAAIAMLFAAGRALGSDREIRFMISFVCCLAVSPLLAIWAALTIERTWLKVVVAVAVSMFAGFVLGLVIRGQGGPDSTWWSCALTFAELMVCLVTLRVVRACGYRLLRLAPSAGASPGP